MSAQDAFPDNETDRLFREGSDASFLMVYDHYAPLLLKYAASRLKDIDDAADLVHDVFLKAWESREHVRSVKPYLYTLLRHRLIDHIRRNTSRTDYTEMLRTLATEPTTDPEQHLHARDVQQFLNRALGQLPPRTREIFQLRRDNHFSISQIAHQLDISEQTVKNQLSNARNQLRKVMSRA